MDEFISEFRKYVIGKAFKFQNIPEEKASIKASPDKWSKKEILGHLIDSASNNHQRFVRACFKDDLIFTGYSQDEWVKVQNYQTADWSVLIDLWKNFNLQLAHVMEVIPVEIKTRRILNHNFHEMAWKPVPQNEPATLEYFIKDYVGHLKHHINQLLEE